MPEINYLKSGSFVRLHNTISSVQSGVFDPRKKAMKKGAPERESPYKPPEAP